jgi:hypothetical protein
VTSALIGTVTGFPERDTSRSLGEDERGHCSVESDTRERLTRGKLTKSDDDQPSEYTGRSA